MKTLTAVAAIAIVSFGLTTSASAFTFSPANTFFGLTGSFSLTKGGTTVPCTASWEFHVNPRGSGKVTHTSFAGSAACNAIQPSSNISWRAKGTSTSAGNILGMGYTTSLGTCGLSTAPFTLNGSGVMTFTNVPLTGGCTVSASLQSQPVLSIVP